MCPEGWGRDAGPAALLAGRMRPEHTQVCPRESRHRRPQDAKVCSAERLGEARQWQSPTGCDGAIYTEAASARGSSRKRSSIPSSSSQSRRGSKAARRGVGLGQDTQQGTALPWPSWEAERWIPWFSGAGAVLGVRGEPLSRGVPRSDPAAPSVMPARGAAVSPSRMLLTRPRGPRPEGRHTHQLDALGKGVVLPVLLRETLEYLSLSIPTPCRDKRGIRGSAAGTHPAFQPPVTPGWRQQRDAPALRQPDTGSTEETLAPSTNTAVRQHRPSRREKR